MKTLSKRKAVKNSLKRHLMHGQSTENLPENQMKFLIEAS